MTSAEFAEWRAYYELEPFGPLRDDQHAGVIAATIANVFRGKRATTYQSEDFFPIHRTIERHQTWEEQLQIVEAYNIALGGIDLRDKKPA